MQEKRFHNQQDAENGFQEFVESRSTDFYATRINLLLIGKDPDAGRDWGQEEKGMTEDEMAGWHHRLEGHEFE